MLSHRRRVSRPARLSRCSNGAEVLTVSSPVQHKVDLKKRILARNFLMKLLSAMLAVSGGVLVLSTQTQCFAQAAAPAPTAPGNQTAGSAAPAVPQAAQPALNAQSVGPAITPQRVSPAISPQGISPAMSAQGIRPAINSQRVTPAISPRGISPAMMPQGVGPAVVPGGVNNAVIPQIKTPMPQRTVVLPNGTTMPAMRPVLPSNGAIVPGIGQPGVTSPGKQGSGTGIGPQPAAPPQMPQVPQTPQAPAGAGSTPTPVRQP